MIGRRFFSSLKPNQELYMRLEKRFSEVFKADPCHSALLRFAWHDAGTYDKNSNTGGPRGSIRFKKELSHEANKGLSFALTKVEEVKKDFPEVNYADLIQAGGYAAVTLSGGPEIEFQFGRKEAKSESECAPEGRLPDATQGPDHLREVFYRMGFDDVGIVALSGAHTLGRAYKQNSGFEGAWTHKPNKFDNSYFKILVDENRDPSLLRLPTDHCLVEDRFFKTWVENFARDEHLFFQEYAKAHKKLSELGYN